jgi:hypothetical protein
MGRRMGGAQSWSQESSVSAADDGKAGGEDIRQHPREHLSTPDCWCHPIEESPGVWVHRLDPDVEGYVPDIKGVIEGDDGVK